MIDLFFFTKRDSILVVQFTGKIFFFSSRKDLLPGLLPHLGMEFGSIEVVWMFWVTYGGQKGFRVRKRYTNTRLQQSRHRPPHAWHLVVPISNTCAENCSDCNLLKIALVAT
jgi:hypothetical protein